MIGFQLKIRVINKRFCSSFILPDSLRKIFYHRQGEKSCKISSFVNKIRSLSFDQRFERQASYRKEKQIAVSDRMALCQWLAAEYGGNIVCTIICNVVHMHQRVHIFRGDYKIDIRIFCYMVGIGGFRQRDGAELDHITDTELSSGDMVLLGHCSDSGTFECLAMGNGGVGLYQIPCCLQ